jgi:hypothetical protein
MGTFTSPGYPFSKTTCTHKAISATDATTRQRTLVTKWVQLFQKSAREQWAVCNGHLHDSIEDQNPHADTLLRLTVKQLYADMDSLPTKDQEAVFGNITLKDRLELPSQHLQDCWVLFAKPVISYIKKQGHLRPAANTERYPGFLSPHASSPGSAWAAPQAAPGRPCHHSM